MIYLIADIEQMFCKIGYSNNPTKRLENLQVANPNKLELLCVVQGDIIKEQQIHKLFEKDKIRGEWFYLTTKIQNYFAELHYKEMPDFIIDSNTKVFGSAYLYLKRKGLISDNPTIEEMEDIMKKGPLAKITGMQNGEIHISYCLPPFSENKELTYYKVIFVFPE